MVDIRMLWMMTTFQARQPYYGEDRPDLAFAQLEATNVPTLKLCREGDRLRPGVSIATAGFPLGTSALTVYGKLSQLAPFLRHGIVSSVFPAPCNDPHGFTIDAMVQGGASGSPIFLPDTGEIVGIVHAGFPNTNMTFCLPSTIIAYALDSLLREAPVEFSGLRALQELADEAEREGEIPPDRFGIVDGKLVKLKLDGPKKLLQ